MSADVVAVVSDEQYGRQKEDWDQVHRARHDGVHRSIQSWHCPIVQGEDDGNDKDVHDVPAMFANKVEDFHQQLRVLLHHERSLRDLTANQDAHHAWVESEAAVLMEGP